MMSSNTKYLCCGRTGRWRIGSPNGVVCPFCGLWHNVAVQQCERCHAWLRLPTYHTRPIFAMGREIR